MTWAAFWAVFLFTCLAGFAVLAIVITMTGFREAVALLRRPRIGKPPGDADFRDYCDRKRPGRG